MHEVFAQYKTNEKGLTESESEKRRQEYGLNSLEDKTQRHGFRIFVSQFTSPLVLLLIGAASVAYFVGEKIDASVILAIILLNSLLGFFQEYKAERALRALKKLVTIRAKVMRDGNIKEIDAKNLVPGDIVQLNIGDIIPADIRLIRVDDFTADESALTGESVPVLKKIQPIDAQKNIAQDLSNMAFMGTSVSSGLSEGVVVGTGEKTFLGETATFLNQKNPETDFQKSIREFGNFLLKITFAMTIFILIANAALQKPFFDSLLFAIALAVGITPEMLPILMTITLSRGAMRMAKKNVITKTLASVEDFGNIDTLCCDKTGTLTMGKETLFDYRNVDGEKDEGLILYGLLCNSGKAGTSQSAYRNDIDKAIGESKEAKSFVAQASEYGLLDANEFDFERRRMSVIVERQGQKTFITKGGAEAILDVCTMTATVKEKMKNQVEKYEAMGYRVIAIAKKTTTLTKSDKHEEKDLTLLGFLMFLDPPKEGVKESLVLFQKLGVAIKIISGDSAIITRKICHEVGLEIVNNKVISGDELSALSAKEFERICRTHNVFARVTPEQKYKIVELHNKDGHVVGFLGDGINDAPALKAADVGISVDSGSGIAKEAADIILLEKSLSVLAEGIVEGRKIFSNITKYILNTISANFGNMFTVAASSLFLKFIPLLPSQILLNNFLSDIPLLTIGSDHVDAELLKKPKRWNIKFISRFMLVFGLISSFFDLALILPLIFIMKVSPALLQTAWFVESALSEMLITFAIRTRLAFWKSRPSQELIITSIFAATLTVAIPFFWFGKEWFDFVKMPMGILGYIVLLLAAYFLAAEFAKHIFYKKFDAMHHEGSTSGATSSEKLTL